MSWSLVAKPAWSAARDGAYASETLDGAITEPPTDGAYTDTGDGWTSVYTLWAYPTWTIAAKEEDSGFEGGVLSTPGEVGILMGPGELGVLDTTAVWIRIPVPT